MDEKLAGGPQAGTSDSPPLARVMGVGRQQQDLDRFNVDQGCADVDIMIEQYDKHLSDLLNKHAPKNIYVVDRPFNEWITDDILTLKAIRRKHVLQ